MLLMLIRCIFTWSEVDSHDDHGGDAETIVTIIIIPF